MVTEISHKHSVMILLLAAMIHNDSEGFILTIDTDTILINVSMIRTTIRSTIYPVNVTTKRFKESDRVT